MGAAPPVVVAGAGPVGLTLAGELALHGVEVLVLERRATPDPLVKAGSIGPLAAGFLRRRGLGDALDRAERRTLERYEQMARASAIPPESVVPREHLAGLEKVEHRDASRRRMRVEQPVLVELLTEHVTRLGVRVLREREVVGVDQDDHEVGVTVAAPDGASTFRASFLIGCDGGDSAVRRLAGIPFVGTAPTVTGRQGVVRLADGDRLPHGFHYTAAGLVVWGLGVDRVAVIEFDGPPDPDAGPMTRAELQESLRRVSGREVTITAMETGGRFSDPALQAETYRLGRVLVAGDAAHLHAPFGGQGLNTGITDAANLGWKLAAHLNGWAREGLLDTYHAERHPVGARLLANTRAQTALMRPDAHSTALRALVDRFLDLREARLFAGDLLSGTDLPYAVACEHPLAGTFCPDMTLRTSGGRQIGLADLTAAGRGVLLDLSDDPGLRRAAAPWTHRVDVVTAVTDRPGPRALLVRPDGYIAWAWSEDGEFSVRSLLQSLRTWFGRRRIDRAEAAA
ncbi:3-(3-hydroxy-phenyl)propionate/3-hydroxycinnamic acid hydroxylase [Actinomadura rubteroloni]|uniref:3-(3-hydroxy-phenyl)propionate/3-hydroxycinnamic acid hydroxylase n=1 Tax=Actinomadura rubteroloni TaxID=1926885 RepID=A0A2P4UCQ3_9ACTN|nr:FAD-dependent monooxygenase [Actinomadura rubteroloni]POM22828.1 3-(3-hydroxy-phenyl)propionate/3-hydroxycinnamic acid hydroxylase [Actinomadura rubteroloni]